MPSEPVGAPPAVAEIQAQQPTEQQIDPYNVAGEVDEEGNVKPIDYDRLITQFGVQPLTEDHLKRFEQVTGKPAHRLMRRKLFFSHRDFDKILDIYEQQGTFMLYTGRGPSSGSMHLGHTVPFLFTKELQEMFDVPLVIMLTDDEKYLHTRDKNNGVQEKGCALEDFLAYAHENIKDIIALGFDPKKTFIYTDYEYVGGHFYWNTSEYESMVTFNQAAGALGVTQSVSVGKAAYGCKQAVAAFASSYPELFGLPDFRPPEFNPAAKRRHKELASIPTLIPCAIDQEPYFRMLRDRCSRMTDPHYKTSLILSKFLTALQGAGGKMSASDANSAIFMSDSPSQIKKKINTHAFSGGRQTMEEHRELGGNPEIDVAYTYLSYFLEDDAELESLAQQYRSGELLTGDMKKRCIEELQKFVSAFQERRAQVTEEVMRSYMRPRKLEYKGNPNPQAPRKEDKKPEPEANGVPKEDDAAKSEGKEGRGTKGERKAAKMAEKKAQKLAMREKSDGADGEATVS